MKQYDYTKEMYERDRKARDRRTSDDEPVVVYLLRRDARLIRDYLIYQGELVLAHKFEEV